MCIFLGDSSNFVSTWGKQASEFRVLIPRFFFLCQQALRPVTNLNAFRLFSNVAKSLRLLWDKFWGISMLCISLDNITWYFLLI